MEQFNDIVCIRYPHLFKPTQTALAVLLLIAIGSATPVDGSGVLWFVTLTCLFVSTTATVLFMLDQTETLIQNLSGGLIGYSVVEFVYSAVLTALCGVSVWLSFGYSSHVPEGGHSTGYIFTGFFMLLEASAYAIPASMIYERVQWEQQNVDQSTVHYNNPNTDGYQTGNNQPQNIV
ncbi:unnamed protein product [Bursaphelenchus okinawaensis]|uniref:MARVEL domain-containing protein n=1 Tax=Bursaphelenchus okinawaensis TaxID=465554 RepID=A0A811K0Q1_9BILA|nr:unnamed protein product [Bursaphelenchus okinawaensis]CAG9088264.1 unnamed protein product [Bursaphelenchus okinawaensis]